MKEKGNSGKIKLILALAAVAVIAIIVGVTMISNGNKAVNRLRQVIVLENPDESDYTRACRALSSENVSAANVDKALVTLWVEYDGDREAQQKVLTLAIVMDRLDIYRGAPVRLLTDGKKLRKSAAQVLTTLAENTEAGSAEKLDLTLLAVQLLDYGFSKTTAAELINECATLCDPELFAHTRRVEGFQAMVASGLVEDIDALTRRIGGLRNSDWQPLMQALTDYYLTRGPEARATAAMLMTGLNDFLNLGPYTDALLASLDANDAIIALSGLDSQEDREQIARLCAPDSTDGDVLLSYLYGCKKAGVQPSTVYPEGPTIKYGHNGMNDTAPLDSALNGKGYYIVVSQEEHTPSGRQQSVRVTEDNENQLVLRSMGFPVADEDGSFYAEDYDYRANIYANNYYWAFATLETRWMDEIPLEHFPSSLEQCNTVIVAAVAYVRHGAIREFYQSTTSASRTSTDYYMEAPKYDCVQTIALLDRETGAPLPCQSITHVSEPAGLPDNWAFNVTKDYSNYFDFTSDKLGEALTPYLISKPDDAWAELAMREMLDSLSAADWSAAGIAK